MEILKKGLYYTRLALFIGQFFLLFLIIATLFQVGWYIIPFFAIYIFYVFKIILEMLSKKQIYQDDFVYNIMQIGVVLYLFVLFYRIHYSYVVVVKETMNYFLINFGIVSALLLFIIVYSYIDLKHEEN